MEYAVKANSIRKASSIRKGGSMKKASSIRNPSSIRKCSPAAIPATRLSFLKPRSHKKWSMYSKLIA